MTDTREREITLSEAFDRILSDEEPQRALALFQPTQRSLVSKAVQRIEAGVVRRAIQKAERRQREEDRRIDPRREIMAARQRADVQEPTPNVRRSTTPGIRVSKGLSWETLDQMSRNIEPLSCIVDHGVAQVSKYAAPSEYSQGRADKAGWVVAMCDAKAKPTPEDEKQMELIREYLVHCGLPQAGRYVAPPDGERPLNWRPDFAQFLRQYARATLTYDWAPVRRWPSGTNPTRYPCSTFACVDPKTIFRVQPEDIQIKDGSLEITPYKGERTNTDEEIVFVKVANNQDSGRIGQILANYTARDLAVGVRNERAEEDANGYGLPESERGVRIAKGWIYSLDQNISRFEKDSLPRGVMVLNTNLSPQQVASFQLQWTQSFQGIAKRWKFPFFPVPPGAQGTGPPVSWIDLDKSNRDMEYHQFLYWMGIIWHILFKMHPASTGWEGMNPVRAPLSEGSAESKFEAGEEMFLTPLLTHIFGFVTQELVWANPQWWGRYYIRPVGLGETDALQDANTALAQLNAGIRNTEMLWAERDLKLPKKLVDDPVYSEALILPMPFAQAIQVVMGRQQQAFAQANQSFQQSMASGVPGNERSATGAGGNMLQSGRPEGKPFGRPDAGQAPREGQMVDKPSAGGEPSGQAAEMPAASEDKLAKAFLM